MKRNVEIQMKRQFRDWILEVSERIAALLAAA